jgi:hypothetical protein
MTGAVDPDTCCACPAVKLCDRWNPAGTWSHRKGVSPCDPQVDEDQVMVRISLRRLK